MNYDKLIIDLYITNKHKINNNIVKKTDNYPNIKKYLLNRYNDSDGNLREIIWRIYYNISVRENCKICGNKTKIHIDHINKSVYKQYCCARCAALSKERNNKYKSTCLLKYGATNPLHNTDIHKQVVQKFIDNYGVDNPTKSAVILNKIKQTCLKKYGVEYVFQSKEFKQHSNKIKLEKYGNSYFINIDKRYNTNLLKYGCKNYFETNEFKLKSKQTCLEKYGVDNVTKLEINKQKSHSLQAINKCINTKRKNNTFNTSKQEDNYFDILKGKYPDIIRQYKDNRYPFVCDFYVPSQDLFIECNFHWTHGGKPFEGTDEDLQKLQDWCNKNTEYYDNAINTWCIRDVRKRKIAKENNLKYIEFWNFNDIIY